MTPTQNTADQEWDVSLSVELSLSRLGAGFKYLCLIAVSWHDNYHHHPSYSNMQSTYHLCICWHGAAENCSLTVKWWTVTFLRNSFNFQMGSTAPLQRVLIPVWLTLSSLVLMYSSHLARPQRHSPCVRRLMALTRFKSRRDLFTLRYNTAVHL